MPTAFDIGDFLTEPFWCGQFVHCSKHPSLRKAKGCGLLRSLTDILFMMYSVRAAHAQNMPFEKVPRYSVPGPPDIVDGCRVTTEVPGVPMICFTELRLSQVQAHTRKYGKLGIGFDRKWLMKLPGANPVFYVSNNECGVPSTNLNGIVNEMEKINALRLFLAYVKPMSDRRPELKSPLSNYDEMEWRMVEWETLKQDGRDITETDCHGFDKTGRRVFVVRPWRWTSNIITLDLARRLFHATWSTTFFPCRLQGQARP